SLDPARATELVERRGAQVEGVCDATEVIARIGMTERGFRPFERLFVATAPVVHRGRADLQLSAVSLELRAGRELVELRQRESVRLERVVVLGHALEEDAALRGDARLDDWVSREQRQHPFERGAGAIVRREVLADVAERF